MRRLLLALAIVLSACQVASASDDRYWSVSSGDWSTASNWGGTEPYSGTWTHIDNGGTATVTKSGETCYILFLQARSLLQMTGGTLTTQYASDVYSLATFTQSGGTHTTERLTIDEQGLYNLSGTAKLFAEVEWIGYDHTHLGTFNQTGGTNTVSGTLCLADWHTGTRGIYNLSGGQLTAATEELGYAGQGTFAQSGGTHTVTDLRFGYQTGSSGTYNLTGGILHVDGSIKQGSGAATFNFGGGTLQADSSIDIPFAITLTGIGGNANFEPLFYGLNVYATISGLGGLNKLGRGSLSLIGTNTYQGGTTVQEGTLSVGNSTALGTGGLTVNGGTVELYPYDITLPSLSGSGGIISGTNYTTGTTTLTVNSSSSTTFAGTFQNGLARTLALTKAGTGTLTLTGTSSYTGQTLINGGALAIEGSIASSNVIVNNGGTLKGSGTVGGVTVNAGGKIAPGNSPGVLTLTGDLTLNDGALLDFELDTPTTSDQIALTSSTLYLNGLEFSDFHFSLLSGFGTGTYTLIDAGSIVGSLGSELVGTLGDYTARLALAGNDVVLRVGNVSEVPEPTTASLLGLAAVTLVLARRRVFSSWRTGDA